MITSPSTWDKVEFTVLSRQALGRFVAADAFISTDSTVGGGLRSHSLVIVLFRPTLHVM